MFLSDFVVIVPSVLSFQLSRRPLVGLRLRCSFVAFAGVGADISLGVGYSVGVGELVSSPCAYTSR